MQEGHLILFLRAMDLLTGQKSCEKITVILYDASGVVLSVLGVMWNLTYRQTKPLDFSLREEN